MLPWSVNLIPIDFPVTSTPILTFPLQGGKDLSPPRWGELEWADWLHNKIRLSEY